MAKLRALIIRAGSAADLKLTDCPPTPSGFCRGIAIMSAIFAELGIEYVLFRRRSASRGAL